MVANYNTPGWATVSKTYIKGSTTNGNRLQEGFIEIYKIYRFLKFMDFLRFMEILKIYEDLLRYKSMCHVILRNLLLILCRVSSKSTS